MSRIFPEPILNLPEADVQVKGVRANLAQGENHQIIFMEFEKDVYIPEHLHEEQWEIVLEGKVDFSMEGHTYRYKKGDRFFIPKGKKHSAKVYAGYASIAYFNQKERYKKR